VWVLLDMCLDSLLLDVTVRQSAFDFDGGGKHEKFL